MVDKKLTIYLKEAVSKGYSLDKLMTALIKEGWDPNVVEESAKGIKEGEDSTKKLDNVSHENLNKESKEFSIKHLKNKKEEVENKRPVGIVVVSILHWIIALSILGSAIFSFFSEKGFYDDFVSSIFQGNLVWAFIGISLIVSLLPLFTGLGIWKGKNVWRIIAIIFGMIGFIVGLFSFMQPSFFGVMILGVSTYIAFYLIISKEANIYFKEE